VHPCYDLTGRVGIVTGAGAPNGIGAATAVLLSGLGARLMLTSLGSRSTALAARLAGAGADVAALPADLTDPAAAAALVDATVARFGGLDLLIANAGMTAAGHDTTAEQGTLTALTPDGWQRALDRNLGTAVTLIRAGLPHLRAGGAGRIVLVASVTGPVMAMRREVAYATAKAGLTGLARALAVDEAACGVTVNVIAPGWIATGSQLPIEVEEGTLTPLGRSGHPDEVAAAIGWLVGRGGGYTTGQVIVIDGGNSVAEQRTRLPHRPGGTADPA